MLNIVTPSTVDVIFKCKTLQVETRILCGWYALRNAYRDFVWKRVFVPCTTSISTKHEKSVISKVNDCFES